MIVFGGLDLPVFEMLFIVSVLLLCGLFIMILGIFYILNAVKELKKVIKAEENELGELRLDIHELKTFEGKKGSDDQVENYIKIALSKGLSWDQVKKRLVDQGWDPAALDKIKSGSS